MGNLDSGKPGSPVNCILSEGRGGGVGRQGLRLCLPANPLQFRVGAGSALCDASVSLSPCAGVCLCVCALGVGSMMVAVLLMRCIGVYREVSVPETAMGLVRGPSNAWGEGPFSATSSPF